MSERKQIPLRLRLRDEHSFGNYLPGPNQEAVHALQGVTAHAERFIFLWGAPGTGKTHLLQATCRLYAEQGMGAAYVPLAPPGDLTPAILDGLEELALVCVDDLSGIAGNPEWETALLHFYNRARAASTRVVIASRQPPAESGVRLPDLDSRLTWGLVLQLRALDDEQKLAALRLRAQARGMDMPEEVGRFLLRRCARDMPALFELLTRLDHASLAAQRRLTIPFVSEVINSG